MKLPDDPYILELLPEFLETWINDIENDFDKYVTDKNSTDLYRMAHTLKGSCFQFGIDHAAKLGIDLMGYCKDNNWEKIIASKQPVLDEFYKMKKYLENNA